MAQKFELSLGLKVSAKFFFLAFPQKTLMFPFFHPERPRFFNMATIYPRAIYSINSGIKKFVKEVKFRFACEKFERNFILEIQRHKLHNGA